MDERLKELKREYEQALPVSFTQRDRERILEKINKKQGKITPPAIFPKALTALFYAATFFIGFYFIHEQFFPAEPGKEEKRAQSSLEESGQAKYTLLTEEDDLFLTFDPETLQPGDQVGSFTVESISEKDGKETIVFVTGENGNGEIHGDLYSEQNQFWFIPDKKSLSDFPIAAEDIGKKLFFTFSGEVQERLKNEFDQLQAGSVAYAEWRSDKKIKTFPNYALRVAEIRYERDPDRPTVILGVHPNADPGGGNGPDGRTYHTSIELDGKLKNIYHQYAQTLDDRLLDGLKPVDVFKLYIHAMGSGDKNVQYALLIKDEKYGGVPDQETYFSDPEGVTAENEKKFYDDLKSVSSFTEKYLSDEEAVIGFSAQGRDFAFRICIDPDSKVWKVPPMAMQ
ncbi:MAG: hypothetical protein CW346_01820 [Bacillaceae bacterium]|nr:hypothetical protein [Bacillaceae bacterium]